MNIANYISEFLKEHSKVEVFGFGEFFLKNTQAKYDETAKSFLPPSKEIDFHINYENSDRTLINYISSKENNASQNAEIELKKTVDYWKKAISENHELQIDELGTFYQTDNEVLFKGHRIEKTTPDFYGLEEIDLKNLKQIQSSNSEGDYQFNKSILWVFLLIIPVVGMLFLAFTQRERLFGKKSFDDISIKTSTHRIKTDSAKIQKEKLEKMRMDSLRTDSLKQDSINKAALIKKPVKKYSSKTYNSKKWRTPKKQANR